MIEVRDGSGDISGYFVEGQYFENPELIVVQLKRALRTESELISRTNKLLVQAMRLRDILINED